jgi:hypothetical protein
MTPGLNLLVLLKNDIKITHAQFNMYNVWLATGKDIILFFATRNCIPGELDKKLILYISAQKMSVVYS